MRVVAKPGICRRPDESKDVAKRWRMQAFSRYGDVSGNSGEAALDVAPECAASPSRPGGVRTRFIDRKYERS